MNDISPAFGLDTSVVVRILVGEPADQAAAALEFIQSAAAANHPCRVSDLVVAEAYFALHTHYHVPKPEVITTLLSFLTSNQVEPTEHALRALRSARGASSKPGFVDRLIHDNYRPARLATFEKAAARLPGAVLLP